jgi:site-specific recombinase XerC
MELALSGAKVATISRKLAAISFRHKEEKLPTPCSMKADRELAQVYAGIRKTTGTKQAGKAAVNLNLIKRMVDTMEGTLTASRDRVLVLIGFAGGLRRSEVAGICFEHLQLHSSGSGITITLPQSKTDQERQGREVEIARGSQPENTPYRNAPARFGPSSNGFPRQTFRAGRSFARFHGAKAHATTSMRHVCSS